MAVLAEAIKTTTHNGSHYDMTGQGDIKPSAVLIPLRCTEQYGIPETLLVPPPHEHHHRPLKDKLHNKLRIVTLCRIGIRRRAHKCPPGGVIHPLSVVISRVTVLIVCARID